MMSERIKFTDGCPNGCEYCYEPSVPIKTYDPIIPNSEVVEILDMNFLSNPKAVEILNKLPKGKYEMVCGFDYRRLTQGICDLIKEKGFFNVRWAWDYWFNQQKTHKKVLEMFLKSGYKAKELSVFVLVNWKIPYSECCKKLDLMKVWNTKVNDCCFDGGYKTPKEGFWSDEEIKRFRKMCRKHNQIVNFGIDPEYENEKQEVMEI